MLDGKENDLKNVVCSCKGKRGRGDVFVDAIKFLFNKLKGWIKKECLVQAKELWIKVVKENVSQVRD